MASNEGESILHFEHHEKGFQVDMYRADWVGLADFKPKKVLTSKKEGKMLYIYKEGNIPAMIFIFYNEYSSAIDRILESIRYKD